MKKNCRLLVVIFVINSLQSIQTMEKVPLKRKAEKISTPLSAQEILKLSHDLFDLLKRSPSFKQISKKKKQELLEKVQQLLLEGADPSIFDKYNEWTALIYAARFGDADLMRLLLDHGGNPNLQDKDGHSLLLWAVIEQNYDVASLLLISGANPNIADKKGHTPLMHAVAIDDFEMAQLLFEGYGSVKELQKLRTPTSYLHRLPSDLLEIVSHYSNRIDVNLVNDEGNSALILATRNNSPKMMRLLLIHGANREIRNNEGMTALDIAKHAHYKNIVKLLQNLSQPKEMTK